MKIFLKKMIAKILVNQSTGTIISLIFRKNINFLGLKIDVSNKVIKNRISAALFFKTYESSEVRYINKYLIKSEANIVELGSSIGVVTSLLGKLNPAAKIFSFEADSRFLPIIEENLRINQINNVKLYNEIIGEEGFRFVCGDDNTMGKLEKIGVGEDNKSTIQPKSLSKIIENLKISDFCLVSDIEGAEYFFLFEDNFFLKKCIMIIIEMHRIEIEGELISIQDMKNKITDLGFKIVEEYGSNIVAINKKLN